jgi:putative endonuclease
MYTVYAIHNRKHGKIYIGQTKDITDRVRMHNEHILGGYTARFDGDWCLIYKEECDTRSNALRREKQLKSYKGRQFVKNHIPE